MKIRRSSLDLFIFGGLLASICSPMVNYFLDPYSASARNLATFLKFLPLVPLLLHFRLNPKVSLKLLFYSFLFCLPLVSRFFSFIPLNSFNPSCLSTYCSSTYVDSQIFNQILFCLYLPFLYSWLPRIRLPVSVLFSFFWTLLNTGAFILVLLGIAVSVHNPDHGFFSGIVGNPNSFSVISLLTISNIIFRDSEHYKSQPLIKFALVSLNLAFALLSGSLLGVLLALYLIFVFFLWRLLSNNFSSFIISCVILALFSLFILFNLGYFESLLSSTLGRNSFSVSKKIFSIINGTGLQSGFAYFRLDYFNYALSYAKYFDCLVLGYCGEGPYVTGDGYLVTLAISFGIPLSLVYLYSFYRLNRIFFCLPDFRSLLSRKFWLSISNYSYLFYISSLLLVLFVNRIQDYWPSLLCFFLLMNRLQPSIASK